MTPRGHEVIPHPHTMRATAETTRVLERMRGVLEQRITPLETPFLQNGLEAVESELADIRAANRAAGLWAPHFAQAQGGMGLSLTQFAHVSELLGRSPLGHYSFNCQAPDVGNMEILHRHGTGPQRDRFLTPLVQGRIRSCFAMTEPEHAGSNPVWMSTTAERQGASWVINGHKWFITAADGAGFALVMAITDAEAPRHRRASQFLVPTDTPGFEHVRRIKIMGEEGNGWHSHSEIRFRDCRVPLDALLGPEGEGFTVAQERLGPGRIHHCMRWMGICARALDMMCRQAATREIAPGQLLGTRQSIQHAIAECRAEVDAARLLVLDTARRVETEGAAAVRTGISLMKFHVAGVLCRVLDRTLQAFGAQGVSDDLVLSHWYRHERCSRIYDGTDEVHKSVVARAMLARHGLDTAL